MDLVKREGASDEFFLDSAGTSREHEGELADARSRACARRHGLEITHRARGLKESDFSRFDLLVAMDDANARELRRRAPDSASRQKVRLFRDWDSTGPGEIPDPYYGDEGDFEMVWHLCDRSAPALLEAMRKKVRS